MPAADSAPPAPSTSAAPAREGKKRVLAPNLLPSPLNFPRVERGKREKLGQQSLLAATISPLSLPLPDQPLRAVYVVTSGMTGLKARCESCPALLPLLLSLSLSLLNCEQARQPGNTQSRSRNILVFFFAMEGFPSSRVLGGPGRRTCPANVQRRYEHEVCCLAARDVVLTTPGEGVEKHNLVGVFPFRGVLAVYLIITPVQQFERRVISSKELYSE